MIWWSCALQAQLSDKVYNSCCHEKTLQMLTNGDCILSYIVPTHAYPAAVPLQVLSMTFWGLPCSDEQENIVWPSVEQSSKLSSSNVFGCQGNNDLTPRHGLSPFIREGGVISTQGSFPWIPLCNTNDMPGLELLSLCWRLWSAIPQTLAMHSSGLSLHGERWWHW